MFRRPQSRGEAGGTEIREKMMIKYAFMSVTKRGNGDDKIKLKCEV